ncbi:hypothetical protein B0H16DRAFT_1698487 [Mycena metata]|uniref:F-box domain-containing protein n=1 Tax=Mycena metata TaxID=1033252 RepID=A0AAD7HNM0_9AGAR|nr:hypothetical protein B0H16DRAFT_1698487 [Mycena metata]
MDSNAALRAEFHALSLSISRQKLLLNEMQARLKNLQAQLDSVVYPVLTLPPEIISEIFVHCLPDKRKLDVVNPDEAPLLLMHVCSPWRQIAIATPQLWSTFEFTGTKKSFNIVDIAETWFNRASKRELSVKLHGALVGTTDLARFLPILQRHTQEMRSLEISLHWAQLTLIDSPLDCVRLQKVAIEVLGGAPGNSPLMFVNVSLLREVSLGGLPISCVALPWSRITKFTGARFRIAECLEALRAMPNLMECAFATTWNALDAVALSHQHIQHLTLFRSEAGAEEADCPQLLGFVTLPALKALVVGGVFDFEDALDSFLSRSAVQLQKLIVHPPGHDHRPVKLRLSDPFFALGLVELQIYGPNKDFVADLLDLLAEDANKLPRLQGLFFRGCESRNAAGALLEKAAIPITKRRHLTGCTQLQSFHVVSKTDAELFTSKSHLENLAPYRKLKESGMDIYIGTEDASDV